MTSDFVRAAMYTTAAEVPQPIGSYQHINGGDVTTSSWTGGARHAQQNPNTDTWDAPTQAPQPDEPTTSDIDDVHAQATVDAADHATDATSLADDPVDNPVRYIDDAASYTTNNSDIDPSRQLGGPAPTQETESEHGGKTRVEQYGWDLGSAQQQAQGALPNGPAPTLATRAGAPPLAAATRRSRRAPR